MAIVTALQADRIGRLGAGHTVGHGDNAKLHRAGRTRAGRRRPGVAGEPDGRFRPLLGGGYVAAAAAPRSDAGGIGHGAHARRGIIAAVLPGPAQRSAGRLGVLRGAPGCPSTSRLSAINCLTRSSVDAILSLPLQSFIRDFPLARLTIWAFQSKLTTPKPFIRLALAGRPLGLAAVAPCSGSRPFPSGHAVFSEATRIGNLSHSTCGFGSSKCRCLGITPLFIDRTVSVRAAIPTADSMCPTLDLTDPANSGRSASRRRVCNALLETTSRFPP